MSKIPGEAKGYSDAPRAIVNEIPIEPGEPHADHSFLGPGYSIAHPGIFPQRIDDPGISIQEWMSFDWRAGWGSDDFESSDAVAKAEFPEAWKESSRRRDGWGIVSENLTVLEARKAAREKMLSHGSELTGPFFNGALKTGKALAFHYDVRNVSEGHSLPSGSLGAQPQIWLNVALVDPDGKTIWESGYVDSTGDVADHHSQEVLDGKVPMDMQLFNLQTKFLTTNLKGTDREMYLPVPFDADQRPYIRPSGVPVTVLNHPPTIRMEQRSIPPLTTRKASYTVPAKLMKKPGTYKLAARMRSRAEPIYFMRFVGSTADMIRAMNERMAIIHPYTVEFEVK